MEDYNEGRSLLERCDKLLNSIAEMTAPESQPSPVSVLDSSFYRDDSPSPSPIMKRNIDFKGKHVILQILVINDKLQTLDKLSIFLLVL